MTKFTKEQLQQIVETDHVQCGDASAMARQLLAGLEQEPVYQACKEAGVWVDIEPDDVASLKANGEQVRTLYAAPQLPQPTLTVWYGSMPESNGAHNWTAILHRKGDHPWEGITIDRSEYPDRVRYEADRMRFLIGEVSEEPDCLAYDADEHSGYIVPVPALSDVRRQKAVDWLDEVINANPGMKEPVTCRSAMLQGAEPVSQPYTLPSREHFESLCCQFWNWRELDSINEGEEEPRLRWDGNDYTHRVTKALWRMYQAASQPHNEQQNIAENIPTLRDAVTAIRNSGIAIDAGKIQAERDALNEPDVPDGYVLVPVDMTPEQMRAVQLNSELGSYAAANLSGAYSLFREFWGVAVKSAPNQEAK